MSKCFLYCKNGASIKVTDTLVRLDDVLEIIDRHINFTRDCHEDISPLMGLRKDIEQMKGGDTE